MVMVAMTKKMLRIQNGSLKRRKLGKFRLRIMDFLDGYSVMGREIDELQSPLPKMLPREIRGKILAISLNIDKFRFQVTWIVFLSLDWKYFGWQSQSLYCLNPVVVALRTKNFDFHCYCFKTRRTLLQFID